jgi:hypothetical protein
MFIPDPVPTTTKKRREKINKLSYLVCSHKFTKFEIMYRTEKDLRQLT